MSEQNYDDGWTIVQRIILPSSDQTDTVSLYVDAGSANGIRLRENDELYRSPKLLEDKLHLFSSENREAHFEDLLTRHSMRVRSGEQISFGTYFNAFPASYWRRWTHTRDIRLSVNTSGSGTISVYKSNARGSVQRVDGKHVDGASTSVFDLTLKPFGDGGWYWFDLAASADDLVLESAEWLAATVEGAKGQVTLQITTMDKPEFCLNNARILAENSDVLDNVKEILIVDQGSRKVQDQDEFSAVHESLEGKLRVINQVNLGGSGGFARGMYEAVENGSDYVLLLDDDVVVEPESIVRLVTFADHCRKPTIVGGHMFDLYNRSVLHTFGEVVDPYRIVPALPHADMETRHDFSTANLRQTPWLHRRVDVDYNGWWMCLIPTHVIKEIGLSLPLFIKWDDAEYGLRAREAGYSTVSLPGAAVWHVSWIDKDDLVGWQAYFHERNRLITTLIHSPYPKGGRVLRESVQSDVKHLVSMQYFTEHGRIEALKDLLRGPEDLHKMLGTKLPEINATKARYPDALLKEDVDEFPAPKLGRGPLGGDVIGMPSKKELIPWGIKTVARQLIKAPGAESAVRPQGYLAHRDNRWFRVAHYDSVVVSNAEGTGASWYQRDPRKLRKMLTQATKLHMQLFRNWEELADRYRRAVSEISSMESWKKTFDAASEGSNQ
ncbi:galactofuranosylgalactofuranosylrhamnosyl-N-acetylglucosaminyl-diphospho-decaprenol beta-1,5/1,6-galactofuranosyltransferase [Pseudarthrobacter defluvii]|uniref:Galactofuranosylgalactofuranosylrhamnosyl-N-acetylglucosaminyl-diphospho-decaprenol beta-1,5/1,6-galactofuranosyltransferase n=1 Tax=Pseudarthrobacter defluvii TaxID=410837 RepID=A0ABT9UGN0_9MICC|nr:glycosyltransferase [Pseudarthrobacter defluvii]MDQ0117584.1 galactofuranosylgalactofuranosylrhamnosyl-N-acetylglucosaminyl-diphospho-decaprenol beta-1,5/1,6-galactofuranosyltransferase [Pseudarthrobacter defluvii]